MDFQMIAASGANTGALGGGVAAALMKALDSGGYVTDVSQLTGGGALRIQSLDRVMQTTIQENEDFKLFNRLPKPKAGATVDEWTEQNGVGGFLGGSTNTESGNISQATGSYQRQVGLVKFLMTMRSVTFVQTLVNSIADSEAVEFSNGALQLLSDAEYLSFEGDDTVVPTEFTGIKQQLIQGVNAGQVDPSNVIDLRAQPITSVNPFNKAAAQIAGFGNFGRPTDFFCSYDVQADLDSSLDPAFRVALTDVAKGGVMLGAPVTGIRTSHGNVASVADVFIRDEPRMQPFELIYSAQATACAGQQPSAVVPVVANDGTGASQWTALQAGMYYYGVAGVTAAGQSFMLKTAQVAIGAGQMVTLTISPSAGGTETGYVIYRGRLNGTNASNDMREMVRIPKTAGTTVYIDRNQYIPGTSTAYMLNLAPSATAITWRQLLPMIKFNLYPTNNAIVPWAQLLFGYLRISKRKQQAVFTNILTQTQTWRPFN